MPKKNPNIKAFNIEDFNTKAFNIEAFRLNTFNTAFIIYNYRLHWSRI